jgi:ribonuclease HI
MLPKIKTIVKKNDVKLFLEADFVMYFDGCSKGNPGIAGAGAVIYCLQDEIWSGSLFVGKKATNNQAEYAGLIYGLEKAKEMNIKTLLVKGDSQLIINQMIGKYKCNSDNIIPLYEKAKELEKNFENIYYSHILRNYNKKADYLSNKAIRQNMNILDDMIIEDL